jgi:dolichol-phosphate mannosyltransferase
VQPIYIFGTFGIICIFAGLLSGFYALFLRFFQGVSLIQTPMPLLSVFLMSIGVISILLGLIAELLVRTYFESQGRSAYLVRNLYNFDNSE